MLSIIICSRKPLLDKLLSTNIELTIGVEYELIFIDNSKNTYSIFSAYNEGIDKSRFPFLCFVHDDVKFNTPEWGLKVINHLNNENIGLVGLAGGDAMLRIPFDYGALNRSMNIIHVDKTGNKPTEHVRMPIDFQGNSRSVLLLDGVMLCARKNLFDKIRFDELMGGFHAYDYDISIQSFLAGFSNLVMYDIEVEHFSKGRMNAEYFRKIKYIYEKWESILPVFERNISTEDQKKILPKLEIQRAKRLLKWLVRSGMPLNEAAQYMSTFIRKTGNKRAIFMLYFSRIKILFIYIISTIRNKNIN
ncbi:MAG: glycosyltransferase [Bacteroidota bacterium]|jgi:Glycosyltransferase like family